MVKAAAGNFVAAGHDLADKPGILFGDPAEDKECRASLVTVEQIERLSCILLITRNKI